MQKTFTFIDLFAGIGGMRIPFERELDGKCVFTSEKDPHARNVYSANFGEPEDCIDQDISEIAETAPKTIPDHDLLLGGFPCQPFSHAGKKAGFEDTRGTLFFSIVNIVKAKKPKVILLENVRGLRGHDGGRTFSVIQNSLSKLGYVVYSKVLNARDFGLPQNRNRIFIVAIRKDIQNADEYEFPSPTCDRSENKVRQILEPRPAPNLTISDRLWAGHKARKFRNIQAGKGFGYQLFSPADPYTATISARYYKDGSEILIEQKGKNPRKLSVREALNLQGFPRDFQPHPSSVQAYKQTGNAVPVPVIAAIAISIKQYLI